MAVTETANGLADVQDASAESQAFGEENGLETVNEVADDLAAAEGGDADAGGGAVDLEEDVKDMSEDLLGASNGGGLGNVVVGGDGAQIGTGEQEAAGEGEEADLGAVMQGEAGSGSVPDESLRSAEGFEIVGDPSGAALSTSQADVSPAFPNRGILGAAPKANVESIDAAKRMPTLLTFYLVRVPRPDLSDILKEIPTAEIMLEDKRKKYQFIHTAIKLKQSERREVAELRREHRARATSISEEVNRKFSEIKPMQDKVREIRDAGSEARFAGRSLQANSLEELQQRIAEIEHRIQHESISLQEEKKLLREMQALEKSRPEVEAHEARKLSVTDQEGHREGLQTQLKPLLAEVEALKLQREAERRIADSFNSQVEALDAEIASLTKERQAALDGQEAAYSRLKLLRQESYSREVDFRLFRKALSDAQQLASAKDIAGLEKFCADQVERFHAKWSDPLYRKNYIKANENSTLRRFQSLDTRRPGLDEDPAELISAYSKEKEQSGGLKEKANGAVPQKHEPKPLKMKPKSEDVKQPKERVVSAVEDSSTGEKKEVLPMVDIDIKPKSEESAVSTEAAELAKKREEEYQVALKEKRREEAFAKSKEAEERKKRLAEKVQARAQVRAMKDAEEAAKRREKEKLRKERKKAASSAAAQESEAAEGTSEEVAEEGSAGELPETVPAAKEDDLLTSRQRKRAALQKRKAGLPAGRPLETALEKQSGSWPLSQIYVAVLGAAVIVVIIALLVVRAWSASAGGAN